MEEIYILKNKSYKIKIVTADKPKVDPIEIANVDVLNDVTKIPAEQVETEVKIKTLVIERENSPPVLYASDEEGYITDNQELGGKKIKLSDFANQEKRTFYKQLIQGKYNEIENVVILSGAGSSVGIGLDKKGLTMANLWDSLAISGDSIHFISLIKKTKYCTLDENEQIDKSVKKDLELLLSKAGMLNAVHQGADKDLDLEKSIDAIKSFIVRELHLKLDEFAPHAQFLNKVALRPQKYPRIKIFTLNYDTLFEQAAVKERFTVIDGFTFSNPRIFNGKYFDYDIIETRHNRQDKKDSTIAKLFYLFKMHGSLNWKTQDNEIEQFEGNIPISNQVMIFPQNNKYEHSYEQPYFEMMARFQQALRTENTLLITIGFSFYDKHISSVILESLKQNSSLNIIALTYPDVVSKQELYQSELHRISELQSRITLVAETFKDFTDNYPENIAHHRLDVLESLNEGLKQLKLRDEQA
ncbi:SIR2 family protein [Dyadobacter subterraneus]|uniref:SIR2 family protein n=1 Tax=Dyadobacter subterraneus TaxID=2773304 RepID=A0ABR9W8U5_9BACT|nr:SIR2 family protein [Dyadobacter subterraneus]MBE9461902.1 SIR2 family protein [Dyadobacter subterraneus]